MQPSLHAWMRGVVTAGVALAVVVAGGHLTAQTPRPGEGGGVSGLVPPGDDEVTPRLFAGRKGEVFRMWQRRGDPIAGGGAVFLATGASQDALVRLFEMQPRERGASVSDPDLAVGRPGELAVAYRWRRHHPREKQVRVATSRDGGKTWTQSTTPVDTRSKAFEPRVAWARGQSLVVAWSDERRAARSFDIYARRSPDGGATWEPEQLLSRFPSQAPNDLYARVRLVGDDQDRLWAVWVGLRSGRSALYLSRSTDAGRTWTDPVPLSGDGQSVFGHSLVRAADRLLLVWQDTRTGRDRIYAAISADGGLTWTAPARVDHIPDGVDTDAVNPFPLLDAAGEALVAWEDGRNGRGDIFLARSTDGGRTWGPEDTRLDADDAGTAFSRVPRLARGADGRVALVWHDDRSGYGDIYLRVRSAGPTGTWSPETKLTSLAAKQGAHLADVLWGPDAALHVTWEVWDYRLGESNVKKHVSGRTLRP